jgi:hypothetical protein
MWEGAAGRMGILVCGALATLGCGSDGPACGTVSTPDSLKISSVQPAVGSSVPNSGIVESFTIVGRHLSIEPSFKLGAGHTAGVTTPNPSNWALAYSGEDTVYTSQAITWATAPGHVELDPPGVLKDTSTGCVLTLPTPTFSYDVTAP